MAPAPSKTLQPIPADLVIEDGTFLAKAAADMLVAERGEIQLPDLNVTSIGDFLAAAAAGPQLSVQEKMLIVEQAILLFEKLYPHLPFKKQLYDFAHPVESLTAILQTLQTKGMDDADFHSQVICACSYVVDAHTVYGLPAPWRGSLAFLPFQMRCYRGPDQFPRFTVTRVMKAQGAGLPHPFFVPGAEIVYWNRSATDFVVENSHGRLPAGNQRARISRGAFNATLRPLAYCELPHENVETFYYTPPGSTEMHAISFPWMVATGLEDTTGFPASTFSVSVPNAISSQSNRIVLYREEASAALALGPFLVQPGARSAATAVDLQQTSALPLIFQFQHTDGGIRPGALNPDVLRDPGRSDAKFGYIRIASFGDASTGTDQIVNEFRRILRDVMAQKAPDGLVLDIRGNPGGDVAAAESMLQMLTSRTIVPINFHLVNSPAMIGALRQLRDARTGTQTPETEVLLENAADLQPWIHDVEVSAASQDVLTTGHPLTSPEQANAIGQIYHGRCSLIVDALAYSAADILAGGFQDNEIGLLVGTDPNTGGGGANVWQFDDLRTRLPSTPDVSLQKLPEGNTFAGHPALYASRNQSGRGHRGQRRVRRRAVRPVIARRFAQRLRADRYFGLPADGVR